MAATVHIEELNGGGETATDKTSGTIRFKNADNATVDLNNPMVVPPTSGYDYSYLKYLRLNVTGGSYTQITNPRWYTDGSNGLGTGIEVYAKAVASYTTPVEASSVSGYTDLFTYTSGSPLDGDGNNAGPFTSTGQKGDYIVLFMRVDETASQGIPTAESLTAAWDEI